MLTSNEQVSKRSNNFVYERGASKKIKQKLAEDSMTEYSEDERNNLSSQGGKRLGGR